MINSLASEGFLELSNDHNALKSALHMEKPSGDSNTIENLPFTPFIHTFKKDSPCNPPT